MDDILIEAAAQFRARIKVPSRAKRKLAGSTLCAAVFVYLTLLPLAFIGQMFALLGRFLKMPLKRLGLWMMPAAIRLWYIHRVGRLHPWQCAKTRMKQKLGAHSRTVRVDVVSSLRVPLAIHVISQLHDNYAYLVVNTRQVPREGGCRPLYRAFAVDVGDAAEFENQLHHVQAVHYRDGDLELEAVLVTHHHWDHMGGNAKLVAARPSIRAVYGGALDRVVCATDAVSEGDVLSLIGGAEVYCHETPAHTLGSITYRLRSEDHAHDCLFLGDTFFIGGSGAHFEGDPHMMDQNFTRLYLTTAPDALLFPGHEYSERILALLFPEHATELLKVDYARYQVLASQYARVIHLRSQPQPAPTVPVALEVEANYNPHFADVIAATRTLVAAIHVHLINLVLGSPAAASASTKDTSWDRMTPSILVSDERYMLVEPPWIIPARVEVADAVAPSVKRGLELFFSAKLIPQSVAAIEELLEPFGLEHESGELIVSVPMLEKCARAPMATGFPNLNDSEASAFRGAMATLVEQEDPLTPSILAAGGPYIRARSLLNFVVATLRPTLAQVCRVYGKTFRDDSSIPQSVSAAALRVPYHDFTECQVCAARAVYVRGHPLAVSARNDNGGLARKPFTLSVVNCRFPDTAS